MKKIITFLAGIFCFLCMHAQTFNGSGGNIPGNGQFISTINVSGTSILNNNFGLQSVCLSITHPNVNELEILLIAPDGTYAPLSSQNPSAGANYTNTCFTATASAYIHNAIAPFNGSFLPDSYLGSVNNGQNGNGSWQLLINDRRNGSNAGKLVSWSLTFSNTPAPAPPALQACSVQIPTNVPCSSAPSVCNFSGICGDTKGTAIYNWPNSGLSNNNGDDGCFGLDNNTFMKFVASESTAAFNVSVPTSSSNLFATKGIQILFFSGTCGAGKVSRYGCYPRVFPYNNGKPFTNVVTATGLTPGNTYYMMIDGLAGDKCTFVISSKSGVNILNITPDNPTICAGGSVDLTATGGGGTFTWSPAAGLNTTSGATVTAAPLSNQTYTVTSTPLGACPLTKDVMVTVNSSVPAVTGFSYASPVCATGTNPSPVLAANFTAGGVFSAPAGVSINPSTGLINLAASTPGTYDIKYEVSANGCQQAGEGTASITISSQVPAVTNFSYTTPVCFNGINPVPVFGANFTAGGVFSAPLGVSINGSTGVINLPTSSPGNFIIKYDVAASGCQMAGSGTANIVISQSVTPVTTFSYASPVCANSVNPAPVFGTGFTAGGTFSAPAAVSINASTGVINPAASTPGSYTISYNTVASGCQLAGSGTANIVISQSVTPVTTFSYASPVCANSLNPAPVFGTGFTAGGTFSAPAPVSINASTGVINLAASTPGSYTISYNTVASGCQLAGSGTANIVISQSVTPVTTFSYASPVCANSVNPAPVFGTGFTAGGTFSAPAAVSINASTGVINLAASTPGSYTISYNTVASGCQLAGSGTDNIVISSVVAPVTGFSYATPVCASGTNPVPLLTSGFTTGGVFSAPAAVSINANTGVINLAVTTAGTYTINYNLAAIGCQAAASSSASIVIGSVVAPVTGFSYTSPVCASGTNPVPLLATGFTTGGIFSAPAGVSINANTGVINLAGSTAGTYTINYNLVATGCQAAASNSASIVIGSVVTPVTGFSYATPVCASGLNPKPVTNPGFVAGGVFSAPLGVSINGSTGEINLPTSTAGTYTINYNLAAIGCQAAASSSASIVISSVVAPVTGFSYTSPVCASGTNPVPLLTSGFTTGGIFSAPAAVSINANTGVINLAGSSAGSYLVSYNLTANTCQAGGKGTATIVIDAGPVLQTNKTDISCFGDKNGSATVAATGGLAPYTYNWSNGSTTAATTGLFKGSYTVIVKDATGCSNIATLTVSEPAASLNAILTLKPAICNNNNGSISSQTSGGTAPYSYSWLPANGNAASLPNALPGNYLLTVTDKNGCSVIVPGTVANTNPLTIRLGPDTTICGSPEVKLSPGSFVTYLWQDGSTTPVYSIRQAGIFWVKVRDQQGCEAADTIRIVADCGEIWFPTSFTPNSDGLNETFGPLGNLALVKELSFTVFNRFGEKVFESSNAGVKWNGICKGQVLTGNYVWFARYKGLDGKMVTQKGNVVLIR